MKEYTENNGKWLIREYFYKDWEEGVNFPWYRADTTSVEESEQPKSGPKIFERLSQAEWEKFEEAREVFYWNRVETVFETKKIEFQRISNLSGDKPRLQKLYIEAIEMLLYSEKLQIPIVDETTFPIDFFPKFDTAKIFRIRELYKEEVLFGERTYSNIFPGKYPQYDSDYESIEVEVFRKILNWLKGEPEIKGQLSAPKKYLKPGEMNIEILKLTNRKVFKNRWGHSVFFNEIKDYTIERITEILHLIPSRIEQLLKLLEIKENSEVLDRTFERKHWEVYEWLEVEIKNYFDLIDKKEFQEKWNEIDGSENKEVTLLQKYTGAKLQALSEIKSNIKTESDQNHFCIKMPLDIPKNHFRIFTEKKSKINSEPFLTGQQLNNFIERAFCAKTELPKERFNKSPKGEKLLIQNVFYEFYHKYSFEYFSTSHCREDFIRLLTENFEGWNYKNVKENFTPKTQKRL